MTHTQQKKVLENNLKGIDNAIVTLKSTRTLVVTNLKNVQTLVSDKTNVKKSNGKNLTIKPKVKPTIKAKTPKKAKVKPMKVKVKVKVKPAKVKKAKVKPMKVKAVKTKSVKVKPVAKSSGKSEKVQAPKEIKVNPKKDKMETQKVESKVESKSSLTPAGKPMPVKEAIKRILGSSTLNPPDIYPKISELGKWSKQSMYNALKDSSKFEKVGSGFKVVGVSPKAETGTDDKPSEKKESKLSDKSNGKKAVRVSDDEADDFIKQVEKMSETKEVV